MDATGDTADDGIEATDRGRREGDGPTRPQPDEDGIDVNYLLRYERNGLSLTRYPWRTDAAPTEAGLAVEAYDGEVSLTAERNTDDELAHVGFTLDPDDAETLAALLVEFAEHARYSSDGELMVWP